MKTMMKLAQAKVSWSRISTSYKRNRPDLQPRENIKQFRHLASKTSKKRSLKRSHTSGLFTSSQTASYRRSPLLNQSRWTLPRKPTATLMPWCKTVSRAFVCTRTRSRIWLSCWMKISRPSLWRGNYHAPSAQMAVTAKLRLWPQLRPRRSSTKPLVCYSRSQLTQVQWRASRIKRKQWSSPNKEMCLRRAGTVYLLSIWLRNRFSHSRHPLQWDTRLITSRCRSLVVGSSQTLEGLSRLVCQFHQAPYHSSPWLCVWAARCQSEILKMQKNRNWHGCARILNLRRAMAELEMTKGWIIALAQTLGIKRAKKHYQQFYLTTTIWCCQIFQMPVRQLIVSTMASLPSPSHRSWTTTRKQISISSTTIRSS